MFCSRLKNLMVSLHVEIKCLGEKSHKWRKTLCVLPPDISLKFLGSAEREEDTIKLVS